MHSYLDVGREYQPGRIKLKIIQCTNISTMGPTWSAVKFKWQCSQFQPMPGHAQWPVTPADLLNSRGTEGYLYMWILSI